MTRRTTEQRVADAKAIAAAYYVTEKEADFLRAGARKYANYQDGALYDGRLWPQDLRSGDVDKLIYLGYATMAYVLSPADRKEKRAEWEKLSYEAFSIARYNDPELQHVNPLRGESRQPAYIVVLELLQKAKASLDAANQIGLFITPAGREVAAKWKESLGAKEE